MNKDDLYSGIVCALTHNISVCDNCRKCGSENGFKARMNLVSELAKYMGKKTPWREDNERSEEN